MKKLLGVIGILALAAALLPASGYADLRGSFAPLTTASGFVNGCEQGAYRPIDPGGIMDIIAFGGFDGGRHDSQWFAFSTRSLVPGHEQVRSIWLHLNLQQSGYFAPLLNDPAANTSYFDPAWSYDGKYLAYIQANADGSGQTMYVQQYFVNDDLNTDHGGSYDPGQGAEDPIGAPILVTNVGHPRHPNWRSDSYTIAFDSDAAGSPDIYTVDVDVIGGTAGAPVRRTFDNIKAETDPSCGPSPGHADEIIYSTNKFGPRILEIVNTSTNALRLPEVNFSFVSHSNPDWAPDGNLIYYDAPTGESPSAVSDIWQLDMGAQAKCELQLDIRADADPDVSGVLQHTRAELLPYYYFIMTSQAAGFGVAVWRANTVNSCNLPLGMGVAISPTVVNFKSNNSSPLTIKMNFPQATKDAGYRCRSTNRLSGAQSLTNPLGEGMRMRTSIFPSPTLLGLAPPVDPDLGSPFPDCFNTQDTTSVSPLTIDPTITCFFDRRTIVDRMVALGLTDRVVPLQATMYSNLTGRGVQGFAYIKVTKNSGSSASVAMLGNSPNPFNPVTTIKFSVSKPGNYALRVYNVQGALVKTVSSQHYEAGFHEAMWDGRNASGSKVASGVYYAKISGTAGESSDAIRLVVAK